MFSISTSSTNMKDIFAWHRIYGFVLLAWLLSTGKWPSPLLPHSVTGPTLATFSLSGRPSLLTSLLSMHLRPRMHFCFSYCLPQDRLPIFGLWGARQFSPFQRAWSDCVGDDLPPNQRCRGSRLTQCGLTAHHDNLLTAQRRSLIQSFMLLRTQRTWGNIISRQSGNQETLILDSELLQPVWKRGNFDSQYFASLWTPSFSWGQLVTF